MALSDSFSGAALDPSWTLEGPAEIAAGLSRDGVEAWLDLVTPDGRFDAWRANTGARIMQPAADEDFRIAARFLSTPAETFQMQGLLAEEDADTWVRFDIHYRRGHLYAFGAVTEDGVSTRQFRTEIFSADASHVRVDRDGDTWTMDWSADGRTWTEAGRFDKALAVTKVGVFAGNTGPATGYTARVDWFDSGTDRLGDEGDRITGTAQDDSLRGGGGADLIAGRRGHDDLGGGGGRDKLLGGPGADTLEGGAGRDRMKGGSGSDVLAGQGGADVLNGGGRNDLLEGGGKRDVLRGANGDDTLTGGKGADTFQFDRKDGADVVTDWQDRDSVAILNGARTFDGLDLSQTDDGVVISWRATSVLFEGTELSDFSAGHFDFG